MQKEALVFLTSFVRHVAITIQLFVPPLRKMLANGPVGWGLNMPIIYPTDTDRFSLMTKLNQQILQKRSKRSRQSTT
jgi:hypothetical protein